MPKAGQYNHHISTCIHPTIFDNTYYYSTMVGATSISTFLPSSTPSYILQFRLYLIKLGSFSILAMYLGLTSIFLDFRSILPNSKYFSEFCVFFPIFFFSEFLDQPQLKTLLEYFFLLKNCMIHYSFPHVR